MRRAFRQPWWCLAIPVLACGAPPSEGGLTQSYRIQLERGGGFTGLYRGCTLHGDGRVERWHELPGGLVEVQSTRSVPARLVHGLRDDLQKAAASWRSDETGNMTSRVRLEVGDSTASWSWKGVGQPPAPEPFLQWHKAARELCGNTDTADE